MSDSNGPFAFIRAHSCKSRQYVTAMEKHGRREDKCQHYDHTKPKPEFLVGSPNLAAEMAKRAREINAGFRKGGPYGSHLLLQASREFFTIDGSRYGEIDPEKVRSWRDQNIDFVKTKFGDDLVQLRIDLDETTPHMDAFLVHGQERVTKTGKRKIEVSHNALFGSRAVLYGLHDEYAASMAPLGLKRGRRGAHEQRIPPAEFRERMAGELAEAEQIRRELEDLKLNLETQKRDLKRRADDLGRGEIELARQWQGVGSEQGRLEQLNDDYERRKKSLLQEETEAAERAAQLGAERDRLRKERDHLARERDSVSKADLELSLRLIEIARQEDALSDEHQKLAEQRAEMELISVDAFHEMGEWQDAFYSEVTALAAARDEIVARENRIANQEADLARAVAESAAKLAEAKKIKSASDQASRESYERQAASITGLCVLVEAIMRGEIERFDDKSLLVSAKVDPHRGAQILHAAKTASPYLPVLREAIWPIRKVANSALRQHFAAERQKAHPQGSTIDNGR